MTWPVADGIDWPLTRLWLSANERGDIKLKCCIYDIVASIADGRPYQRNVKAYERWAARVCRRGDD